MVDEARTGDFDGEEEIEKSRMPLVEHLTELRRRLLYSLAAFVVLFLGCFYFADIFFNFLVEPLARVWEGQEGRRLIYTALHEKFFTNIKVAFFAAAFLGFPVLASQIWRFVATGGLAASRKQLDIIGFLFLAGVTAIGGGTFRDLVLDVPVFWIANHNYLLV